MYLVNLQEFSQQVNKEIEDMSITVEVKEDDRVSLHTKKVVKKQINILLHLLYRRYWKSKQLQHFEMKHWFELTNKQFNEFYNEILSDIIQGTRKGMGLQCPMVLLHG